MIKNTYSKGKEFNDSLKAKKIAHIAKKLESVIL